LTSSQRLGSLVYFLQRLALRLREVGIGRMASSLAFTTILGLVPLFTVAFAYVARFPLLDTWLDQLEPFLLRFVLPGSSRVLRGYISEFTAKSGELKGIGTIVVVITAMMLVAEIEREVNAIWGITKARSVARRIVTYALGFVAVPVLIGSAIYVTTLIVEQSVEVAPAATEALSLIAKPFSLIVAALVLAGAYMLIPARPVPFRSALIGASLATAAFAAAKYGFTLYIHYFSTYEMVYGALAALPLFLIWIYLCWIILLSGAAVAATLAEATAHSDTN
jgi:membrane protein